MDEPMLRNLLEDVRSGVLSADDAVAALRRLPFADLGFARVDHHRALRQGFGEAVYGPGKTPEHCAAIVEELLAGGGSPVILTRADDAQAEAAMARNAECVRTGSTLVWRPRLARPGRVLVLTAGTADLPVATECVSTLRAHGFDPLLLSDVGVAGVHRLLASVDELAAADAVVVVAGMEGALASLVGGMTPAPVVAVPTSVGYGASLEGVTA
ncbi:MAG TPA: nickel pincer cofactor biosynthesis protein LarB, partial [Acidimicrobiales bacterium]